MNAVLAALRGAADSGLAPRGEGLLLAVSGGADSMALLCRAAEIATEMGWALTVAHVHHGWRGREADRDLEFVAGQARRLGLAFLSRRVDARASARTLRLSPEAGARHVRYAALRAMADEAGARLVATAHQADDVLESHLLAVARRGGLASLAGPRAIREDGVVRPLLGVSRREILDDLSERGIAFRRDASNGDLRLARNRVRREVATLDADARADLLARIAVLRAERDALDRELARRVPPGNCEIDVAFLDEAAGDLARAALERLAAPFARAGRAPMTGREREQVLRLVRSGRDFRFEAGRRIRIERRGALLRAGFAPGPSDAVYHFGIDTSSKSDGAETAR